MSLSDLNNTAEIEVGDALYEFTASSAIPLLLMESFDVGALCCGVPSASYMIWIEMQAVTRAPLLAAIWTTLAALITHWALALQQLTSLITGRALAIPLTLYEMVYSSSPEVTEFISFGLTWQYAHLIVTETVLFGFASSMFGIVLYVIIWKWRSERRFGLAVIIPIATIIMYSTSVTHWVLNVRYYTSFKQGAEGARSPYTPYTKQLTVALMALTSTNTILSDSVVLWRMCAVWSMARPALSFSGLLMMALLALNIANIIAVSDPELEATGITHNVHDSELIWTFGQSSLGQAVVFMSMGSNISATFLVALKAWMHRRHWAELARLGNRRTLVMRVMELLVESSIVYMGIWVLYCASFFRRITTQYSIQLTSFPIDAVDYLDAVMVQITTIYPLLVFIVLAVDKSQYTRGYEIALQRESPRKRTSGFAGPVAFSTDAECFNNASGQKITLPMIALNTDNGSDHMPK
ncbi:unnamed protein product [Peniophora sp. CBMAI 1063]|nr:unnamed protein product [Peniophora sp. CBMAI 1063]